MAEKYNWIETQNKHFNFSSEGMSILRCMTYGEMNAVAGIDALLKKVNNNPKKLSLSYLNLGEIYFKFHNYDRAAADSCYLDYKIEMLKLMDKYDIALEVIIADKNATNKRNMINDILSRKPNLRQKSEELIIKYKVNLK